MKTIEIENIVEVLDILPKTVNVMLLGDTGIGKSSVVRKYCKDNNIYMQTLLLSTILASESLGIPMRDDDLSSISINNDVVKIKTISTAIPKWVVNFINNKNKECILFLDEFMCATPETQNAFLNFMCLKEINGLDLSFVRIILASNIGNYTYKLDKNMLNRICFINCINSKSKLKKYFDEYKNKLFYDKFIDLNIDVTDYSEIYKDDLLFEERNLSPRQLDVIIRECDTEEAASIVYEGYTNKKYEDIKESKKNLANTKIKITGNVIFDKHFINQLDMADNEIEILDINNIVDVFDKLDDNTKRTIVVSTLDVVEVLHIEDAKMFINDINSIIEQEKDFYRISILKSIAIQIQFLIDKGIILS